MSWRFVLQVHLGLRRVAFTNSVFTPNFFAKKCTTYPTPILIGRGGARFYTSIGTLSSGVHQIKRDIRLNDEESAKKLVDHFRPDERALLLEILMEKQGVEVVETNNSINDDVSFPQIRQVFLMNMIPFIGFGILDNMIMLLAGEYIDQTIGVMLGISTMAAAALGNIISDVAGVGLAHYVEKLVSRLGFNHPELTPKQYEQKRVRFTVNWARAVGLVIGCLIGMFPLLFFKSPNHEVQSSVSNKDKLQES